MEKIPLIVLFLGHEWVAVSGWIADMVGLYKTVWILAVVPVVGSVLAALIRLRRDNLQLAAERIGLP